MPENELDPRGPGFANTPKGIDSLGDNYLFVIAIDKYSHKYSSFGDLKNPINDAVRFMDVLHRRYTFEQDDPAPQDLRKTDPERYTDAKQTIPIYNGLKTKTLYNDEANWENIKAHLNRLFAQPGGHEHDNLIVYFAGHGEIEEGGKGKIVMHRKTEDDDRKIPYENFCYDKLDNYLVNKQFRHVLYIFDCCYAGSFNLGTTGNTEEETFTRYALSSCALDQTAADAIKGTPEGSPFSIVLCDLLENRGGIPFSIGDIEKDLKTILATKTQNKQSLKFAPMATKMSGQGEFKFVLNKTSNTYWTMENLRNSIMDNLGFEDIRGSVTANYLPIKSKINILSTCSEEEHIHKILGKIIFRTASTIENENRLNQQTVERIALETSIWEALLRHKSETMSDMVNLNSEIKHDIVNWLIGRLQSDQTTASPMTIILHGPMSMIKDEMLEWCNEFAQIFKEKATDKQKEGKSLGKLFFYFQETKQGKPKITNSIFEEEPITKEANIIITPSAKKLNFQSLKRWVRELPEEISPMKLDETALDEHVCKLMRENKLLPPNFDPACSELDHKEYTFIIFEAFQIEKEKSIEIINSLYS